jgi:hypothetical protein
VEDVPAEDERDQQLHDDDREDDVERGARPGRDRDRRGTERDVHRDDERADDDQAHHPTAGPARFGTGHGLPGHGQVVAPAELLEPGTEQLLEALQVGGVVGLGAQGQGPVLGRQRAPAPAEVDHAGGVGPRHTGVPPGGHPVCVVAQLVDVPAELGEVAARSGRRDRGVRSGHRDLQGVGGIRFW